MTTSAHGTGPADRSGHWRHGWIPLDPPAASEKFHGHVPEGWRPEAGGKPSGPWVTTLKGDQQFYHVTRRPGPIASLPSSAAGESGPGVYLAQDRGYADQMASWDKTMRVLPVTVHAGSGLRILDRTRPGGEAEYRRLQTENQARNGSQQRGLDKTLAENGYHGVRNLSPGNKYPETVIHDPGKLTVHDAVGSPASRAHTTFADRTRQMCRAVGLPI